MDLSLSPAARYQIKNVLICFSLGNLCFLRRWSDLEQLKERSIDYYRASPIDATLFVATLISAILLAACFWLASRWVERKATRVRLTLARCGFILVLLYSIETLRLYWQSEGVRDARAN